MRLISNLLETICEKYYIYVYTEINNNAREENTEMK